MSSHNTISKDNLPLWKKLAFYSIMFCLLATVPLALIGGYLGYRKLTLSYEYCGSYAQIDDQLGWRLAANQSSCVGLQNRLQGKTYFSSTVYTNKAALRSLRPDSPPIPGALLAIGDSWVFGYGVNYEQAWPYKLGQLTAQPVNNLGVPSYSSAQTYLLLERELENLKPKTVIHYNNRMWKRSICIGTSKPTDITEPCFWVNPESAETVLTTPPGTYVSGQAAKNILPGGMSTSGYDPWHYFLVIRPLEIIRNFFKDPEDDATRLWTVNDSPLSTEAKNRALTAELTLYARLMKRHGFNLVWIDPYGFYAQAIEAVAAKENVEFIYFGSEAWNNLVETPTQDLSRDQKYIPEDGHFTIEMNTFVAKGIAEMLVQSELAQSNIADR